MPRAWDVGKIKFRLSNKKMNEYINKSDFLKYLEDLGKPQDIGFNEESTLVSVNLKTLIQCVKDFPSVEVDFGYKTNNITINRNKKRV